MINTTVVNIEHRELLNTTLGQKSVLLISLYGPIRPLQDNEICTENIENIILL